MEEKKYYLKYVGLNPTQTETIDGRRRIEPQEVFETTQYQFKSMLGAYSNIFKEVDLINNSAIIAKPKEQKPQQIVKPEKTVELSILELTNIYNIKFGVKVPVNKKNNREWIYSKIYN